MRRRFPASQQHIGGRNVAGVTLGSVTSYIGALVAGVTLGSVTSYISASVAVFPPATVPDVILKPVKISEKALRNVYETAVSDDFFLTLCLLYIDTHEKIPIYSVPLHGSRTSLGCTEERSAPVQKCKSSRRTTPERPYFAYDTRGKSGTATLHFGLELL